MRMTGPQRRRHPPGLDRGRQADRPPGSTLARSRLPRLRRHFGGVSQGD